MSKARRTIVLLSPYSGGNLGEASILTATIENFRKLDPSVEFKAVTLRAGSMRRLHGVDGMRLVSYGRNYYSPAPESVDIAQAPATASAPDESGDADSPASALQRAKSALSRRLPRLYRLLKALRAAPVLFSEAGHCVSAMRFLRSADLMVVAGSGQIDDEWGGAWGHPYALYKWTAAARLVKRPVAFISVGASRLAERESRWLIARALARARLVTLRDPWSLSFVRSELGCDGEVRPDLAFSLPIDPPAGDRVAAGKLMVGLSPIAYGRKGEWPVEEREIAESYLAVFEELARRLLAAGHSVALFHTDHPDREVAAEIAASLRATLPPEQLGRLSLAVTDTLDEVKRFLPTVDATVASRLHSVILSHLHGVPSLAISYDRKVAAQMELAGHADLCVDLAGVRLEPLLERFASLERRQPALRAELLATAARWRRELEKQYAQTLKLAEAL